MTWPDPINTVTFKVSGSDEEALWDEARRILGEFAMNPDEWSVGIDAKPDAQAMDGTVTYWEGEVTAVRHDD